MATENIGISFSAKELAKRVTMTVNISGYRGWKIRLKVATFLAWLACKIVGTNFEIE